MAFTQDQLTALEEAYAAGVLSIRHGEKTITYASLEDLWNAILRLRVALAPKSKRFISGRLGYSKH